MGIVGGFAQAGFEFLKERSKHEKAKDLQGERLTSAEEIARKDRANRLEIANKRLEEHKLTAAAAARAAGLARDKYDDNTTWNTSKLMGYDDDGNPVYRNFKLNKDQFSHITHMEKGKERNLAVLKALYNTPQMNFYNESEENIELFKKHWGGNLLVLLEDNTDEKGRTTWISRAENLYWARNNIAPRITVRDQLAEQPLLVHGMWVKGNPSGGVGDRRTDLEKRMHRKWLTDYGVTKTGKIWSKSIAAETHLEYFGNATTGDPPSKNIDIMSKTLTDISDAGIKVLTRDGKVLGSKIIPYAFSTANTEKELRKNLGAHGSLVSLLGEQANFLLTDGINLPNPTSVVSSAILGVRSFFWSGKTFFEALMGGSEGNEGNKKEALEMAEEGLRGARSAQSKGYWDNLITAMKKDDFFTNLEKAKAYQITSGFTVARGHDTSGKLSDNDYKYSIDTITGVGSANTVELLNVKRIASLREYHISRLILASKGKLEHATVSAKITEYSDRELLKYSPYKPDRELAKYMEDNNIDSLDDGELPYVDRRATSDDDDDNDPQEADKDAMPAAPLPKTQPSTRAPGRK